MQRLRILRSRFFWNLFLTYTILFSTLAAVLGWQVYHQLHVIVKNNLKYSLKQKTALLLPLVEQFFNGERVVDFSAFIGKLGDDIQTRITVVDHHGRVIADSQASPESLENHAQRPEIIESMLLDTGYSERFSQSLQKPLIYLATPVRLADKVVGFVRVAFPVSGIERDLEVIKNRIILATLLGIALALIVAFLIGSRVAIPIAEMMRVCDAMRRGHYNKKVKTLTRDEIGKLGDTLNRLGQEITNRIVQIGHERARLNAMLTGMIEGVIAVDDDDRISFCNRAAYKLLGATITEGHGLLLSEAKGFDQLVEVTRIARESRELVETELRLEIDGNVSLLEVHVSSFDSGDEAQGVIIVLHDITKIRKLEKIRRDFVANVSHEIKTPLTSIRGYVETLRSEEQMDRTIRDRFFEKIERNVERLNRLVQDILSLAQIESHEEEIVLKPTDVGSIVKQVVGQYENLARSKKIAVQLDEVVKPMIVNGDKEAIFQICNNLFTNAVRYTPPGGKITITIREHHDLGVIEVEDTGIGIPRKHLERIFERFYRIDKARSRELGGTGLGLSIVKHLVASLKGSVTVESEVGLGSKFTVSLPLSR